jgi:hypothetical protein
MAVFPTIAVCPQTYASIHLRHSRPSIRSETRMFVRFWSETPPFAHPISRWVFWFRQQRAPGNKVVNYEEGIKRVSSFNSVLLFRPYSSLAEPRSSGRVFLDTLDASNFALRTPAHDRLHALPFRCPTSHMGRSNQHYWRQVDHTAQERCRRPRLGRSRAGHHRRSI